MIKNQLEEAYDNCMIVPRENEERTTVTRQVMNEPLEITCYDQSTGTTVYSGELETACMDNSNQLQRVLEERGKKKVESDRMTTSAELQERIIEATSKKPSAAWTDKVEKEKKVQRWKSVKQLRGWVSEQHNPYPRLKMTRQKYVLLKNLWTSSSFRRISLRKRIEDDYGRDVMSGILHTERIPIAAQALSCQYMSRSMARRIREQMNAKLSLQAELTGIRRISNFTVIL